LEEHVSVFKDNGYNLLGAVVGLDDATLIGLGISLIGHRSLLVRHVAKLVTLYEI
jgi:hypothetical protein